MAAPADAYWGLGLRGEPGISAAVLSCVCRADRLGQESLLRVPCVPGVHPVLHPSFHTEIFQVPRSCWGSQECTCCREPLIPTSAEGPRRGRSRPEGLLLWRGGWLMISKSGLSHSRCGGPGSPVAAVTAGRCPWPPLAQLRKYIEPCLFLVLCSYLCFRFSAFFLGESLWGQQSDVFMYKCFPGTWHLPGCLPGALGLSTVSEI